jgi:hypothetical protein
MCVELTGDGLQRGRAHGEALRPIIHEAFGRWKVWLARYTGMDPVKYIDRFLEETHFPQILQRLTPDLLSEVQGIAEGANAPFDTTLAWQCMDEYWWHMNYSGMSPFPAPAACSGFAVWGQETSPNLLCQNDDLPNYFDGAQCLLRLVYPGSELEILTFTLAGMINQNGVNSFSTAAMVNTLYQLDHSPDGLPATFITRRILESRGLEEAEAFVTQAPHASGLNYLIAGLDGAVDMECSANQVVQCSHPGDHTYLVHTNHPLCNNDTAMYRSLAGPSAVEASIEQDRGATSSRLAAMDDELRRRPRPISVADAKSILSRSPVCVPRGGEGGFTVACTVVELGRQPVMHVAFGPPDREPFHRFEIGAP